MFTIGDVAGCSHENEEQLYRLFGKNAIVKGLNFQEGATGSERNSQIGGHWA